MKCESSPVLRLPRILGLPEHVSIRHLALGMISFVLALVAAMAGYGLYLSSTVSEQLVYQEMEDARDEALTHVKRLLEETEKQAGTLARWDETKQQLFHPEYYGYWRDQRVYEAGLLQDSVAKIALYDANGKLIGNPNKTGAMPVKLPMSARSSWLSKESDEVYLYQRFPVHGDDNRNTLLGYGLIRVSLLPALLQNSVFYQADRNTLRLNMGDGEVLDTMQVASRLTLEPRPNPNRVTFQEILSRTLFWILFVLICLALLGYQIYKRLLVKPLQQLVNDISSMQQGRTGGNLSKPLGITEMDNIRRSLHTYQLQLRELHGTLETQNREFHTQARQDALTGCYNRRAYDEDWQHLSRALETKPQDVAYLLFDCDRFKSINDTYGHAKGDRVLVMIADALVMALRANDRLYRLGGDEFAAVLVRTTPAQSRQIAKRCQSLIEAASFTELGIQEPVSISIGIAFCSTDSPRQLDELPKQADIAMYTAKQPGRSRIATFGEDTASNDMTLVANRETSALFQALVSPGMIEMHYQPIHTLPGRQLDYYEALARIRYGDELLMPGAFLPVVSSRRLEADFDTAVLNQLDVDLSSAQIPGGCGVSINLSAQSMFRPEVISQLLELSRHIERHPLMLEITETSLITQIEEVRAYLDLLRSLHYRVAMDDFGTGYSPLRYLVDLPVDVVKFDISLIRKLNDDDRASQIVADFARMMSDAGYELVAEGVETEAMLRKVEALGFGHVQGYLLGRPQALSAFPSGVEFVESLAVAMQ
jgi:diguanylate cyclase (GGDEF)-like protein